MNILVITQMYPQPDDVGENKPTKTVEYFAKEWVAKGNQVVVIHCPSKFPLFFYLLPNSLKDGFTGSKSTITPSPDSRKALFRKDDEITVFRFPMFKLYPGKAYSERAMNSSAKKIRTLLATIKFVPEVVVGHFANPSLELVALLSEYYNSKSSIVFHHDCTETNVQKYRIDKLIHRIGAVGARSIVEAKEMQMMLSLEQTPFVCYSGVPNNAIDSCERVCSKHDYKKGVKYLYVGSLLKNKRVDAVITAFSNKYRSNKEGELATLNIYGGGPEFAALNSLVLEYKMEGLITLHGKCSRNQVLEIMQASHVFSMVSERETFGMVYIEAMLQGCIVIASIGGGFDGIIQNGVNGFLCNPGDAEMLERIFDRIYEMSVAERNQIGQNAIDTALGFSDTAVAERYLGDVLTYQSDKSNGEKPITA